MPDENPIDKLIEEMKKDPSFGATKQKFDAFFAIKVKEIEDEKAKAKKDEPKGILDIIFGKP